MSTCGFVCSGLHARHTDVFYVFLSFPFLVWTVCSVYMGVDLDENWACTESIQWLWLLLWIWQGLEKFCVSSTIMVIKTEFWTGVHSPVVRVADCRSAGPWFNSGGDIGSILIGIFSGTIL